MARLLCVPCRNVVEVTPDHRLTACPSCGSTGVPADADDTVTLTITTHELRILTIWASNWAAQDAVMAPVVRGILDGLAQYTAAALSLSQEIADLRAAFPNATVTVLDAGDGAVGQPPEGPEER